ncbi:Rhomboid protease GlpG [Marinomonas aquimarina]|uniref:Rhomboid protease GlpG n=1 Tax=Marinomonas aquimarina TaxID=295068 RepID=A0A1A8TDM4_9GAMM|nr:rhomboid family intramembrane serine protease [Marinomonas aquimarina]SBS31293.1 Rhomboid protease GlpG [Marinomonas aquimarina]
MLLIYEFAINEQPHALSKLLWQHRIGHRIVQANNRDQLWILNPADAQQTQTLLELWQQDPSQAQQWVSDAPRRAINPNLAGWHKSPITITTLLVAALIALITGFGENLETLSWFTISSFDIIGGNRIQFEALSTVLEKGEYWRLLTPAFIHFGAAHLIFNALWVWEVGRKLERLMGSLAWLVFALCVAIASNVGQYVINGYPLFGGLSGLVYGLIAFAWAMPWLVRGWPAIISKPLMVFFVIWLILGYTDVFSVIGLGNMANEAHLLGLISGLACAGVYSVMWKLFKRR